jgi:2-amino-4-hydroxy-6-hydroxymethyldihydropteridine diphosphokinase
MILIAIGANLPRPDGTPPLETGRQAVAALDLIPNMRLIRHSRWYESEPIPPSGQKPYINAVVRYSVEAGTVVDPAVLLARLMAIEDSLGRVREALNAPRTLDLDIVAMGERVRTNPDPILPHPRAHLRAFVLMPIRDVAPGWVHPVLGKTVEDLIAHLPPQQIRAL